VNGTEPPSADHPFVLQRSVAARGVGPALLLRHDEEGQEEGVRGGESGDASIVWRGCNLRLGLTAGPAHERRY
jgi:hypothetical protein